MKLTAPARQRLLFWIPMAAFALLIVIGTLRHEPWRDEADSWLIARDGAPSSLVPYLRNGGTPGLWYLVLIPFAKAGCPYATQAWINALIAVAAGFVFLRRAPFPLGLRCLLLFSYFPAYEYSIVARSYGLSMLLLFVAEPCWEKRHERPLPLGVVLALLANTNAQSLVLAACLALWRLLELAKIRSLRGRNLVALEIAGIGMLLAIAQIMPETGRVQPGPTSNGVLENLTGVWQNAIVPARRLIASFAGPVCLFLNAGAVLTSAWAFARRPRVLAFYVAALVALSGLFAFVYYGGIRHAGFILLATITAWWIYLSEDPVPQPAPLAHRIALLFLGMAAAASCLASAMTFRLDYRHAFSGARDMAGFLRRGDYAARPIAVFPDPLGAAVLPYLPQRTFWYAGRQEFGSYMKWDAAQYQNRRIPLDFALQRIDAQFAAAPTPPLILVAGPIDHAGERGYRLLHQTGVWVFSAADERYWLYDRAPSPGR